MKKTTRACVAALLVLTLLSGCLPAMASDPTVPQNAKLDHIDEGLIVRFDPVAGAVGYNLYLWDGANNQLLEYIPAVAHPENGYLIKNIGAVIADKTYTMTVMATNSTKAASLGEFIYTPEPGDSEPGYKPDTKKTHMDARLNQRMATRLGPSTGYSEELGTFPQATKITVLEQVMGNGVPWVLVDFYANSKHYRAYTGLKRINTAYELPWGETEFMVDRLVLTTDVYYGPGTDYAKHKKPLYAGQELRVFFEEDGFYLCDWDRNGQMIRGYIPASALGYAP